MGKRLSEDEVQRALDFCVHLFNPTTPEQHEATRRHLSLFRMTQDDTDIVAHDRKETSALLDPTSPIVHPAKLDRFMHVRPKLRSSVVRLSLQYVRSWIFMNFI